MVGHVAVAQMGHCRCDVDVSNGADWLCRFCMSRCKWSLETLEFLYVQDLMELKEAVVCHSSSAQSIGNRLVLVSNNGIFFLERMDLQENSKTCKLSVCVHCQQRSSSDVAVRVPLASAKTVSLYLGTVHVEHCGGSVGDMHCCDRAGIVGSCCSCSLASPAVAAMVLL